MASVIRSARLAMASSGAMTGIFGAFFFAACVNSATVLYVAANVFLPLL
jgi:hypothetical protein